MRAKSEYPTRHADQHNPDGSDPIAGMIRYDVENVGDWLSIETTDTFIGPDPPPPRMQGADPGMVLKIDSANDFGSGLVIWAHDTVLSHDPVWQFTSSGSYYFLNGQNDIGYTEGGNLTRYSGGGGITFYTTDPDFNNAGDFSVFTSGSLDNQAGDIYLDARYGDDTGEVQISYGDDGTLTIKHHNTTVMQFQADGTIHIQTGATIIADL